MEVEKIFAKPEKHQILLRTIKLSNVVNVNDENLPANSSKILSNNELTTSQSRILLSQEKESEMAKEF